MKSIALCFLVLADCNDVQRPPDAPVTPTTSASATAATTASAAPITTAATSATAPVASYGAPVDSAPVTASTAPTTPYVRKRMKQGEGCGGIAGMMCEAGLTCKMPAKPYPDQMGVCAAADGSTKVIPAPTK